MKKIIQYFIKGLLFVIPVTVVVYLIYIIFLFLDNIIDFNIPGLGVLVVLTSITIIGFLFQLFVATPFYKYVKKAVNKVPLVKVVYTSIKDLLSAFVGNERKFENPVLVTIDKINKIKRIGFITQKDLSFIKNQEGFVAVTFPNSYGILGELCLVPEDSVEFIEGHPAEVMKFIVSGGISKFSIDTNRKRKTTEK